MSSRRNKILNDWGGRVFETLQARYKRKTALEAERAGEKLGLMLYILDSKHRNRARLNLAMAYPEWTGSQVQRTAKGVFRHFGRVGGDFLRAPARSNDEVLQSIIQIEGLEHLEEVEEIGKGALFFTGHIGNWERCAQWVTGTGRGLSVVARDANQEGVQAVVLRSRLAAGVKIITTDSGARGIVSSLRKKDLIGILADQNSADCFVPFFGKMCGSVLGPAVLHQRTKAPLLPWYCMRVGPAQYKIIIKPQIDKENVETDGVKLMAELNRGLEAVVREYPEQWLWMHDRWKSARQRGLL